MSAECSLIVYFEDPFWVGGFERIIDGKLSACKITFGAEPKDYDVLKFVLDHYYELEFSQPINAEIKQTAENPKRRQRNIKKQLERSGIGTKSQEALKMQIEALKIERHRISREERDAEEQRRFELKQEKRKEKQKGH